MRHRSCNAKNYNNKGRSISYQIERWKSKQALNFTTTIITWLTHIFVSKHMKLTQFFDLVLLTKLQELVKISLYVWKIIYGMGYRNYRMEFFKYLNYNFLTSTPKSLMDDLLALLSSHWNDWKSIQYLRQRQAF